MSTQLNILRHPEVDETLCTLSAQLVASLEAFERVLSQNGDLSTFTHTKPFSAEDGLGNRTNIEHYHLMPCRPDCYLVWLVRTVDTAYLLDVSLHPTSKGFTSREIEERNYSRLAELCPELAAYKLPGNYRYAFPVRNKDRFGARAAKDVPSVAPVRTPKSDYLPLGQLNNLPEGRNRIGVVVGTFEIPTEEMPEAANECIDCVEHPKRESLTLFISGWACRLGVYKKETEQLLLWFCELHNVVMLAGTKREPIVMALKEADYRQLVDGLKARFPSIDGKERELADLVDRLIEHFPLYRP